MIKYSKLEQILRSRDFILYVVIFSVLWLTPNTYYVYYSFMGKYSPVWREIASGGVALLVASGIMIYTLRNNVKIANYYMWFEISVSSYYYITTVGWDWGLIPAFSFVFMLPISLKHYTTELNKDKEERDEYKINIPAGSVIIEDDLDIIQNDPEKSISDHTDDELINLASQLPPTLFK